MKTLFLILPLILLLSPSQGFSSAMKIQDGDQYFTPSLSAFRARVELVRYTDPRAYRSMSTWLEYWEKRQSQSSLGYGMGAAGFILATLAPVFHSTSILGVGLTGIAMFIGGYELQKDSTPGDGSWVEFVNLHNAELPDRPWRIVGG